MAEKQSEMGRLAFYIGFLLAATTSASALPRAAVAAETSCAEKVLEVLSGRGIWGDPDLGLLTVTQGGKVLRDTYRKDGLPTVRQAAVDDHDGRFVWVERNFWAKVTGAGWVATYSETPLANQGDPRSVAMSLGTRVARALGFRIGVDRLAIPADSEVLNAHIENLNRYLPPGQKINSRYRDIRETDPYLFDLKFIEGAEETVAPYARGFRNKVHDASFHLLQMLLPESIEMQVQRNSTMILNFVKFAEAQISAGKLSRKVGYSVTSKLAKLYTLLLDVGTGNFSGRYVRTPDNAVQYAFETLTWNGASSESLLDGLVSHISQWHGPHEKLDGYKNLLTYPQTAFLKEFSNLENRTTIMGLLTEFKKSEYLPAGTDVPMPETSQDVLTQAKAKYEAIQDAAARVDRDREPGAGP